MVDKNTYSAMFYIVLALFVCFSANFLRAQVTNPTATQTKNATKSWVELMHDPSPNLYDIQTAFENYWAGKTPGKGEGYKIFKRWFYNMEMKTDATGKINNFTANAFQEYNNFKALNPTTSLTKSNTGDWVSLGATQPPGTVSNQPGGNGRLNFVVFHPTDPNIVYTGAPSGGLWKTSNAGLSWTPIADDYANLGASGLVINYNNTNVMYLATGDCDGSDTYTVGIIKTTDGGATWSSTAGYSRTTSQREVIYRLIMHPTDPKIMYAAASSGLYRTTDGWNTSTKLLNGTIFDVEFKPGDPNTVYCAPYGGGAIYFYRSTAGGVAGTWTNESTGLATTGAYRYQIAVSPASPNKVWLLSCAASTYAFYRFYTNTASGAANNWTATYSPGMNILGTNADGSSTNGQGFYDITLAVSPVNDQIIYVGGIELFKSTNGGTSWTCNTFWNSNAAQPYVHADQHGTEFSPHDITGNTVYAACDGGMFKTTDNGTSWIDITNNIEVAQIYRLGGSKANQVITGWQDCGSYKLDNSSGSNAWTHVLYGDGMECITSPNSNDTLYAETYRGYLHRSVTGGMTWATIYPTGKGGTGEWVTPYIMHPNSSKILYSGYDQVYKSSNSGGTWGIIGTISGGTNNILAMAISKSSPTTMYIAKKDKLWQTSNEGTAWNDRTTGLPVANASITYIAVSTTNPSEAWVTFDGFSAGNKVCYTSNGGTSWTNISYNLPNIPYYTVAYDPYNNSVYVGGDFGVYYYDAANTKWILFNNGLPNVKVNELEIYNSGTQLTSKLRAATYGRGLWESDLYKNTTLDAELNTIISPSGGYCGIQNVTPSVIIKNKGTTTLTSANVSYNIDGGAAVNTSWSGSLGTDGTAQVTFPSIALTGGSHTITATVSSPNGGADGNSTNDSYSTTYNVSTGNATLDYSETFDNVTFPPSSWTTTLISNPGYISPAWSRVTSGTNPACTPQGGGSAMAQYNSYSADVNDILRLNSKPLDFTGKTNVSLTYWMYHDNANSTLVDEHIQVQYSTDGINYYNIGAPNRRYAAASAWGSKTIDLSLLDGQPCVYIGFFAQAQKGGNMYLDNISISGANATCTPPSTQATNFTTGTASNNSVTINWNRGNGDNVLVVVRKGLTVDTDPSNGTSYTANSTFGNGSQLGTGNFVVYNGSGTSVNVGGLVGTETYYFAIYEYANTGYCYNKIELIGSASTLGPPTVSTKLPYSVTSNTASSGGTVSNTNGSLLTAKGVCWSTSSMPTINDFVTNDIGGGTGAGTFTSSLSNLLPSTTYNLRSYATNAYGTSYGDIFTFSTDASACGTYYLNLSEGFNSTIIPSCWTTSIVANTGSTGTPAITFVASGSNPTVTPSEGTHFVRFNSYACDAGDKIILKSPAISSIGRTGIQVLFDWYQDNGYATSHDSVRVVYSTNGATWYDGSGTCKFDRYNAANSWSGKTVSLPVAAEGQATLYVGFLFTSAYGNYCSLDNVRITATASCTQPTTQASGYNATALTNTSMTANWTRGNGTAGVIVIAKEGSVVNADPSSGTTYTASPVFGSGQHLGSGNYVVYIGTGSNVNVSNLKKNTTYHFAIYEYNTTGTCYKSPALTGSTTTPCIYNTFPFTEGFEGGVIPSCWTNTNISGTNNWTYAVGNDAANPGITHSGNYNACLKRTSAGTDVTRLITPQLDLSATTNPQLTFWYAQQVNGVNQDILKVYYKTSAAGSWNLLATYNNNQTTWNYSTLALPSKSNDYYIAFEGTANYGYGVVMDDISVCDGITASAPSNQTICEGIGTSFSTTNNVSWIYQWQVSTDGGVSYNDITSAGSSPIYSGWGTNSLTLTNSIASNNGNKYRCVINSGGCLSATNPGTLTITATPLIVSDPNNSSVCAAASTSFTVSASGAGLTYQWQVNTGSGWNNILAAGSNPTYANWTSTTLNVNSVVSGNNGYLYRCVVSGTCSPSATSNAATLTVLAAPIITNISHTPLYPTSLNTPNVSGDITSCNSLTSVSLKWCTDGSSFNNSISMTLGTAPTYTTSSGIPGQVSGTTVSYRIVAIDNLSNTTTSSINSYTVSDEPSNNPTSFTCGTTTINAIPLTWTDATGSIVPTGYLIKGSTVSYAAITNPSDGTPEANGTLIHNVAPGVQSLTFSGLTASTTYYFKIFPYTGSGAQINYKTSSTPQTSCATTGTPTTIVTWNFPNGSDNNIADGGVSANLSKTITTNLTSTLQYNSYASSNTSAANVVGWDFSNGADYWEVEFSSADFNNLKLSSKQAGSTARTPRNFKVQYKIGSGGTWTDAGITVPSITALSNWTLGVVSNASLPSACDNNSSLYIEWITTDNLGNGAQAQNGTASSGIDDIIITGVPIYPSAAGSISGTSVVCQNSNGIAYSVPTITGATSYTWVLPSGATIASGSGTNSITVNFSGSAESGAISVYGVNSNGNGLPSTISITVYSGCNVAWNGAFSTDWANTSNWSTGTVPISGENVLITSEPANQPHITALPSTPASCNNLEITSGALLTIDAGKALTVNGNLLNNGTFTIKSNTSSTGTFINYGSITGSGTFNMEQYLTGTGGATPSGRHWYMSSPMSLATSNVFDAAGANKLWYYNEPTASYTEITNNTTNLELITGFVVRLGSSSTINYTGGTFNSGTINKLNLTRTGTSNIKRGFWLIGNPYPSHVDWESVSKTNLKTTIWFRTTNLASTMVFDTYNTFSGFGTNNNGNGAVTSLIAPMQSIWVRVESDGLTGQVSFNDAARSHESNKLLKETSLSSMLRLKLEGSASSDEAIIYFNAMADNSLDDYDSPKMFVPAADVPQLYTLIGSDSLAINGNSDIISNSIVPLGIKVSAGNYSINAVEISGFDQNQPIYLKDNLLNTIQDLQTNPIYPFTSINTNTANRFEITFGLTTPSISLSDNQDIVVSANNEAIMVLISGNKNPKGEIILMDVLGQKVYTQNITEKTTTIPNKFVKGTYYVKVISSNNVYTQKIIAGK